MGLFRKIKSSLKSQPKENTFRYLSYMIENEKEINLNADIILDEAEADDFLDGIKIEKDNIVINGNGFAIDGKGRARIFEIAAEDIALKNIVFRNSAVEFKHGGAIENTSQNLSIENCVFENNTAKWDGGAINNDGFLSIERSVFKDNSAKKGGGAISSSGELKMTDCKFISNRCDDNGGALYVKNILDIEKCTFKDNHAQYGASIDIYHTSEVTISDSAFTNTAETEHELIAVDDCDFHMKNSILSNDSKSGGISARWSKLYILDSTFKDNIKAIGTQGCDLTLEMSRFTNNTESIFTDQYMTMRNCEFSENSKCEFTIRLKGNDDSTFTIESNVFDCESSRIVSLGKGYCISKQNAFNLRDNYAIFNENGEVEIRKDKFNNALGKCIYNNNVLKSDDDIENLVENGLDSQLKAMTGTLPSDHKGFSHLEDLISRNDEIVLEHDISIHERERDFYEGGIEINRDNMTIDGAGHTIDACGFSRIFYVCANNVTFENITFNNGKYFKDKFDSDSCGGGAIHILHGASVKLINCTFKDNSSRQSSGAIKNDGDELILIDCVFENNIAHNAHSGAIYNDNGSLIIESCDFMKNHSNGCGGAIYNKNGKLRIESSGFKDNSVEEEFFTQNLGGAVYNESGELYIINTNFTGNECRKGGAIFNAGDSFRIDDTYFSENHGEEGASIYNLNSEFEIVNCIFEANESQAAGIYNKDSTLYAEKCAFINNLATQSGGALYNDKGKINLKYCDFKSNRAVWGKCGGAMSSFYGDVNLESCSFSRNSARNGGAIENYGGKWNVNDCGFDENASDWKGGAILNMENGFMRMIHCNFNDNTAKTATDIYNLEGEMELLKCKFKNDEKTIIINKDTITLRECESVDYHEIFNLENATSNILK